MTQPRKPPRDRASYASADPAKRAAQLANLRPGRGAEPGNTLALKHGAHARIDPARVDRQVAALVELLEGDPPLRDPSGGLPRHDRLALELLGSVLVRLGNVRSWINQRGIFDAAGDVRPVVGLEVALRGEALGYCEQLGMTPAARPGWVWPWSRRVP